MEERQKNFYRKLRDELNRFAPGERFYSQRQMIRKFGVSNRIVMSAVTRLEQDGCLERRSRSGYYVRPGKLRRSIVYFYQEDAFGKTRRIVQELGEAFRILEGYELAALPFRDGVTLRSELESCSANIIIVNSMPQIDFELLAWIEKLPATVIIENRDLRDVGLHCFYDDYTYNALLALNCFLKNGHRRIGILCTMPPVGGFRAVCRSLALFAHLHGCQTVWIDSPEPAGDNPIERGFLALSEHIDRYGLNFTGLFLVTGNAASGVLRSLCDHGYSVPDDVSILGFQNAEYCAFLSPPLTVVGGNGAGTARLRATAIDRYLADPASGLIAVPYRAVLIDGKSMKDIRKPFTTGE